MEYENIMYTNRNYVIFDVSELDKINFMFVGETSSKTVRRSIDGTKTFVKWDGDVPYCVETLTTKGQYLMHEEMLDILKDEEWTPPYPANGMV
jgi:hypothetical protein